MTPANPVLLIPGFRGSTLVDCGEQVYPQGRRGVRPLLLTPGAPSRPLEPGVEITAGEPLPAVFGGFLRGLRRLLGPEVDVTGQALDWRLPLEQQVDALDASLDAHIAALRSRPPYRGSAWAEAPRVDLVGQALGASLALSLLARGTGDARVGRVVSIAGAWQGNPALALRTAAATGGEASDAERDAADLLRLSPSTWSLLPDSPELVSAAEGLPRSLLVREAWGEDVLRAIARRAGGGRANAFAAAEAHLGLVLDHARRSREAAGRIRSLADLGLAPEDLLYIVGVGYPTLQRVRLSGRPGDPRLGFDAAQVRDGWSPRGGLEAALTGDGIVPFSTALPPFLPLDRVVCLAPRDLGPFELKDRLLQSLTNLHVALPGMDAVQRLVASFLAGEPRGGRLHAWAPPGTVPVAAPPVPGLELR